MGIYLRHFVLTLVEYITIALLTACFMIIGNASQMVAYYGLGSTTQLVQSSVGHAVSQGLGYVSNFSLTGDVVNFMLWFLVGIFVLSIIQTVGRVFGAVEFDVELTQKRYIHPRTFTKALFWRQVANRLVRQVLSVAVILALVIGLLTIVWPVGLTYARVFLLQPSLANAPWLGLGYVCLYAGFVVLYAVAKLLVYRQSLFTNPRDTV